MKQLDLGLNLSTTKTRKGKFLDEMERVMPWAALVQTVEPHCPRAKTSRPPFAVETMLPIHYLQQWFSLLDPAMEKAQHDTPVFREFTKIGQGVARLPDETMVLRLRHLLERHDLAPDMLRLVNDILSAKGLLPRTGTVVDATLIAAPSSTKNVDRQRDPKMKQTKWQKPAVLRREGPHRHRCAVGPGAHRGRHGSRSQRSEHGGRAAARRRGSRLRRCWLPGRAQAALGSGSDLAHRHAPRPASQAQPVH